MNDFRDLEEKLGDWDMLPVWLRIVLILALPLAILFSLLVFAK